MTYFYGEFSNIGSLLIFDLFLAFLIIFLSFRLSIFNPDVEKVSAYECGFDPYEDARNVFDIRFYLIAILFLVFDLEIVYFFPWCVCFSFLDDSAIFAIIDFIIELLVGFIYIWETNSLNWS